MDWPENRGRSPIGDNQHTGAGWFGFAGVLADAGCTSDTLTRSHRGSAPPSAVLCLNKLPSA